jgi:hypothetical protein
MSNKLPVATQRKILKLERRVFKLERQLVATKEKYEKQTSELKAENHKLRNQPMLMTEERLAELRAMKRAATERRLNRGF